MKSPFPGMDPFLEPHWGDVHTRLMVYVSNQINPQLPMDLQARIEESGRVTIDGEENRTIYPDLKVVEDPSLESGGQSVAVAEVAEPLHLEVVDDRVSRHIEIVDTRSGNRVVSAIEVLSPSNKLTADGIQEYKRKQRHYVQAGVNLLEIDLLRQGDFVMAAPLEKLPTEYRDSYGVCIRRANRYGMAELYRASLTEKLPNVPVPLRPHDRDAVLQLQALIDDCYRDGRYARLNYQQALHPALSEDEIAWLTERLESRS